MTFLMSDYCTKKRSFDLNDLNCCFCDWHKPPDNQPYARCRWLRSVSGKRVYLMVMRQIRSEQVRELVIA